MPITNGENVFKISTDAQLKKIKSTTTFRTIPKPVVTNDEKFKSHDSLLFISQIHASVQEHKLRNLFSPYAEVLGLRLISKENKKFCFMNVRDQKQAEKIISMFDGYSLNGQSIHISYSRERRAVPAANMNQEDLNAATKRSKFYENEESPTSPKTSKFYEGNPSQPTWSSKSSRFYTDDARVSPPNPKFYIDDPKSSELRENKDIKSQTPADLEDTWSANIADSQFGPQNDVNCEAGALNFQNLEKPEYFDINFDRNYVIPPKERETKFEIDGNCVVPPKESETKFEIDGNCVVPPKESETKFEIDGNCVVPPKESETESKENERILEIEEPENNVLFFENIEFEDDSVDFNVWNRNCEKSFICENSSTVSDAKNTDSTRLVDTKLFHEDPKKVGDTQDNMLYGNPEDANDPCAEDSETCGVVDFYNCESEESFNSYCSFGYRPVDFDFDNNNDNVDFLHQHDYAEDEDFGYNFSQIENDCDPFECNDVDFVGEDDIPYLWDCE